ncbi:MAG: tRNA (guanosine(37)-N1)-methyltransferase TrmD [Bdellovibrionales bacterium]|nr:tRNA (guanosine(37)-N1)-methyltransferase TrmD [Bdellovibrionales bacterium]
MISFQVITLFPELFREFSANGLMRRAVGEGNICLETIQLRDFAINAQGQVDDSPYGGGSGMVLRPEPAKRAIETAKSKDPSAKVILLTPRGKPLKQKVLHELADHCRAGNGLIFLCPRYEGVDERIAETLVDEEISIGDYIVMGGELPSMVVIEGVARLLPGVLGNSESIEEESFERDRLEYPQYTKPQEFEGNAVPDVLLSGNHAAINAWRTERSGRDTWMRRPDLPRQAPKPAVEICAALVHYPVVDKRGDLITSSITTIDLHDISRSAKTYGLSKLYIVHPVRALRVLSEKINDHWSGGFGLEYNPNRSEALEILSIVPNIDDMILDIETRTGILPELVTTSAKQTSGSCSVDDYRAALALVEKPQVIVFGTGWGLASEVLERADRHLEPLYGPTDYNHLSVRSAAAIMFDRLFGEVKGA